MRSFVGEWVLFLAYCIVSALIYVVPLLNGDFSRMSEKENNVDYIEKE